MTPAWDARIPYLSVWDQVLFLLLIQLSVNAPENQGVTAQYSAAHTGDPDGISVYCCQPGSSLTLEDIGE